MMQISPKAKRERRTVDRLLMHAEVRGIWVVFRWSKDPITSIHYPNDENRWWLSSRSWVSNAPDTSRGRGTPKPSVPYNVQRPTDSSGGSSRLRNNTLANYRRKCYAPTLQHVHDSRHYYTVATILHLMQTALLSVRIEYKKERREWKKGKEKKISGKCPAFMLAFVLVSGIIRRRPRPSMRPVTFASSAAKLAVFKRPFCSFVFHLIAHS